MSKIASKNQVKSRLRQPDHPYHQMMLVAEKNAICQGELVKLFIQNALVKEWRRNAGAAAAKILFRRVAAVGICDESEFETIVADCERQIARRKAENRSAVPFENWLGDFRSKAPKALKEARRLRGIKPPSTETKKNPPKEERTPAISSPKSSPQSPDVFVVQLPHADVRVRMDAVLHRNESGVEIVLPGKTEPLKLSVTKDATVQIRLSQNRIWPLPSGWSLSQKADGTIDYAGLSVGN